MKVNISWALGFKLFTIAFGVGLVGEVLLPSQEEPTEGRQHPSTADPAPVAEDSPVTQLQLASEPLTRAVLDGIYFDVVRAIGQGEQLQVELRAYNTGADRNIVPGRAKGILEPALFATVFDGQGKKWYADQVRIANATSTSGFLPQSMLVSGVPTAIFLIFGRMPVIAGALEIHTIPRLEVPVIVSIDEPQALTVQEQAVMLVFRHIPVVGR